MPPANFHGYCRRKDRIHVFNVFYILASFTRCINCTCWLNISREIEFYTYPTQRLGKNVGRSAENANEIRADIKAHALLSRSSKDIDADKCTVYGSYSMYLSTVCKWVRKFSADLGLL